MWLPVISPGGSAKGGRPAGNRGRCCSQQRGTLTPCTRQTAAPQNLEGVEKILLAGVGVGNLASRGHPGRRPLPAPTWLLAAHGLQMASASPHWHAYRCGVDSSCASPKGGCRDSASLYLVMCQPTAQP